MDGDARKLPPHELSSVTNSRHWLLLKREDRGEGGGGRGGGGGALIVDRQAPSNLSLIMT